MQVLDAHCGFLSNFEVLQLLREDVAEQDVHVRAFKASHAKLKKQKTDKQISAEPYQDFQEQLTKIVPHNVRTFQVEALQYLRQKDLPCRLQNAEQIVKMMDAIEAVEPNPSEPGARGSNALTKTEKLMLVNYAPLSLVDLTVIIDDLDTRFSENAQQQLLSIFLELYGGELSLASVTDEQEAEPASLQAHEVAQANADEDMEAEQDQVQDDMPDEENDLVDEGRGDGGRDAEIREIDEVDS